MFVRVLIAVMIALLMMGGAEAKKKKPAPKPLTWRIILYKDGNFGGKSLEITGDVPELDEYNFDDTTSSFQVLEGYWQLCEGENYTDTCVSYGPGSWPDMGGDGLRNNRLESVRRMQPPAPPPPPPPAPKPDLTRSVEARSSYAATIEGEGDARIVNDVTFRGITVRVTVKNAGSEPAGASTLRIEPGAKMAAAASYIAAGEHECPTGQVPWPAQEGRQMTCTAAASGELIATAAGTAMTCNIPKLAPGASARCVAVFSVLYNYLVPQFGDWYVTAIVDAGKKVDEDNEKNNGAGDQIRVKGDDLPAP